MFEVQQIEAAMVGHRLAMAHAAAHAVHLPARRSRWRQLTAALRNRSTGLVQRGETTERPTEVLHALAAGPVG